MEKKIFEIICFVAKSDKIALGELWPAEIVLKFDSIFLLLL